MSRNPATLREVKIEAKKSRRHTTGPSELRVDKTKYPKVSAPTMSSDYSYVNSGFVGSTNNVNQQRPVEIPAPGTVYREQYCVCSRWPFAQKILAVLVGILLGAVIGLGVSLLITRGESLDIGFFKKFVPD